MMESEGPVATGFRCFGDCPLFTLLARAYPAAFAGRARDDVVVDAVGPAEESRHDNTSASVGKVLAEVLAAGLRSL